MRRPSVLLFAPLFAVVIVAGCGTAGEPGADPGGARSVSGLSVEVMLERASFAASEPVLAEVAFTNEGAAPVSILSYYLPAAPDDLEEPIFLVRRNGDEIPFRGAHYKRPAPDASDFVTLAPGERLVRAVDLSAHYDFGEAADYEVSVSIDAARLFGHEGDDAGELASRTTRAFVEGRATRQPTALPPAWNACTAPQQAALLGASATANGMSDESVAWLSQSPSSRPRYTTWFGAVSTGNWNTAKKNFVAIQDAFDNKQLSFDCACRKKYYAYVLPDKPYRVYLCGAFWTAPPAGADSQAGTLIHEVSHFNAVAATDDWAYGRASCQTLARKNVMRALDNADSYEFFAENVPALN